MVKVKICGITEGRDARAAVNLGAAALGFNFYESSPRSIAPADAWEIRRKLPTAVQAIGVFVNWEPEAVVALAQALELSAVQLHGNEDPSQVASCARSVAVIKAFHVGEDFSLAELWKFRRASRFLLDAARTGQYGGTGQTTNWELARQVAEKRRILLAGGLTPDNVADAIRVVRPWGVDVASGVESKPGKKDHGKMRRFFEAVQDSER